MYLNAEYARAHEHPDAVVNPMLVLCTAVGLSVEDLSEAGGPFLGIEACHFHSPVYPGDTVRAVSTVIATRESADAARRGDRDVEHRGRSTNTTCSSPATSARTSSPNAPPADPAAMTTPHDRTPITHHTQGPPLR